MWGCQIPTALWLDKGDIRRYPVRQTNLRYHLRRLNPIRGAALTRERCRQATHTCHHWDSSIALEIIAGALAAVAAEAVRPWVFVVRFIRACLHVPRSYDAVTHLSCGRQLSVTPVTILR